MKKTTISVLACIAINTTTALQASEGTSQLHLAERIHEVIKAPIKGKTQIETWRYENSCWKDVALAIKQSCGEPLSTEPKLHRHYYKSHDNWLACMAALNSYLCEYHCFKNELLTNIESITILELPSNVYMYCIVFSTEVTHTPLFITQEGKAITPTEELWKTSLTQSTVFSAIKETPEPSLTQQLMRLQQAWKKAPESLAATRAAHSSRTASARPAITSSTSQTARVQGALEELQRPFSMIDPTSFTPGAQAGPRALSSSLAISTERAPLKDTYNAFIMDLTKAGIFFSYIVQEAATEQLQEHKDLFLERLRPENETLFTLIRDLKGVAPSSKISLMVFSFIVLASPCILYYTKDIRPGVTGDACLFINQEGDIFSSDEVELVSLVTFLGEISL